MAHWNYKDPINLWNMPRQVIKYARLWSPKPKLVTKDVLPIIKKLTRSR